MNPNYEIHERIDRYLNGQMSEPEIHEFENQIRADESLLKTLEAQEVANKIIIGHELLLLKKQISQDLDIKNPNSGGSDNTGGYFITGIAVIITAAILFFLLGNKSDEPQTSEEKFENVNTVVVKNDTSTKVVNGTGGLRQKDSSSVSKKENQNYNKNIASDSIVEFSCQAKASCVGEMNGMIEVDVNTIKTGKAPFQFSISPIDNFHSDPTIMDLKAAKYNVYVKDSRDRVRRLYVKVEVPEIECGSIHK